MVDSPTTRNRLRKQQLGTNTNTWGDTKLNEVLDAIDQSMDGVLTITLSSSADYTLSTTNYSTADEGKRRVLKFAGTVSSSVNVIVPSVEHEYAIVNNCGASVVVKTSAGTGVEVPNGYQARVYCDAVNVYNGAPTILPGDVRVAGQIHNVTAGTAGTASTDAVNKTQMETAIASAGVPASAGAVLNSLSDTTPGYLSQKITASGGLIVSTLNAGGNETTNLAGDEGQAALVSGVYAL